MRRLLGRRLARAGRRHAGAGRYYQRAIGTRECGAERLNNAAIVFAVLCVGREVVIERQMDDAIALGRAVPEAVEIFERPAMHAGAGGGEFLCALLGPREAENLMSMGYQLPHERRADKPRRAGDEYFHSDLPCVETDR